MAAEDLENMVVSRTEAPRTASDNVVGHFETEGAVDLDAANRAAAAEAGVKDVAFINYDVALAAHAARPDIEDLAHKNARNAPVDFSNAAFMRSTTSSQWDNTVDDTDVAGSAPLVDDYEDFGPESNVFVQGE